MKLEFPTFQKAVVLLVLSAILEPVLGLAAANRISLAGSWRFQLDREAGGVENRWFERTLANHLQLPGALQNQGFGDEITVDTQWTGEVGTDRWLQGAQYEKYRQRGNLKVPFFLQPERHYVGVAWYQRDLPIPDSWQGQRVVLTLERAHWATRVWLDGREVGANRSLSTPHVYDLGIGLAAGRHALTIRVDNGMIVNVGSWAHSVSDHTQGNWNGIIGRLELSTTSPVWIDDAQAYPNVAQKSVRLKIRLGNATGKPGGGTLKVGAQNLPVKWEANGGRAEMEVALGDKARLWDEFTPALHKLAIRLTGDSADDRCTVSFGLRELGVTPDRLFTINGRKTFFRGTLECCIFPLTGYPPTDVESWKRVIRVCQAHGLNHIRFHSFCPPEAAFVAADELGFYLSVEIAAWTEVGDGKPIDSWLYGEATRVLKAYGNHPSFVMMAYGNEPSGKNHPQWLGEWVNHWKKADPRRLYTSASGWPAVPENQYHVSPAPRGPKGWLGKDYRADVQTGRGRRDAVGAIDVPVIVHEMGQWCVYPNFDEIKKYTGPLKAKNFEIFRDSLAEHGLLNQWRDFLRASGRLQVLCYKEEIEAAFRTPGVGGVQLLDLHDFPGQGTALVGVLDAFWDSKGYVKPEEYRRFYHTTVPLARVTKRVWTTDESFRADVEIAHFGPAPLPDAEPYWKLVNGAGKTMRHGVLPPQTIPVDRGIALGQIPIDLAQLPAPAQYKLIVGLKNTPFENDWNLWVYPSKPAIEEPAQVLVTNLFNEAVVAHLDAGGKVLLLTPTLPPEHPKGSFTPIFWNRYMFNSQSCQTLGLLCDPEHPALRDFPTDFHSDWQWEDIVTRSRAVVMDSLPKKLRPIVQVIDDWNTNRKLGLVFECRVGWGSLVLCSADLEQDLDRRPAARQLRRSLLAYMAGDKFRPTQAVTKDDLASLFQRTRISNLVKLGAKVVAADSEDRENGHLAAHAIDGDPDTIWHTRWQPAPDPMPHYLTIDLGRVVTLSGLTCLPRQDMANGRIAECEAYVSNDPQVWGSPVAKARWQNSESTQRLPFPQPVTARYLKFVVKSEANTNPFAAVAELDVILKD